MKALLYCCKNKPYIDNRGNDITDYPDYVFDCEGINGSIPCECDYEVEEIELNEYEYEDFNNSPYWYTFFETQTLKKEELYKQSCLTSNELDEYLDFYKETKIYGYAIHIKNLNVFDKPKELKDYYKRLSSKEYYTKVNELGYRPKEWLNVPVIISEYFAVYRILEPLKNAPQNMMYICEYDHSTSIVDYYKTNILIPVHPELLCKILNGECTIIIKKKILKEMLKNGR